MALLEVPTDDDLRGALPVLLSDALNHLVAQRARLGRVVGVKVSERGVRNERHGLRVQEGLERVLREVGVRLDLFWEGLGSMDSVTLGPEGSLGGQSVPGCRRA